MRVVWKSLATSSIFDGIGQEKGEYIMIKKERPLNEEDNKMFDGRIGLALHEYIDAMIVLGQIRFPGLPMFEALCRLCEDHLIPFIWGGMEGAQAATVKVLESKRKLLLNPKRVLFLGMVPRASSVRTAPSSTACSINTIRIK